MSDPLSFVFLQCLIAGVGVVLLLFRQQTAHLGITCLFCFQLSSASLSAFFFGRLCRLPEGWITTEVEKVLIYSGWMVLAMVAAMWLAWLPKGRIRKNRSLESTPEREIFPWITENFVIFSLCLGTICMLAIPFVFGVPTIGTGVVLLGSWLKLGLIGAVILYKKQGVLRPLLIALALYIPLAFVSALRNGLSPLSLDAIIPIALVASCLNRVSVFSFLKLFVWMLPCVYLMFAWMASRNLIRSGELEGYPLTERATRFADFFVENLLDLKVTAYDVQGLLFQRIDMTDVLAQEVSFESSPSGEDEFRYGGTIMDGLYAVVPRALWSDKPTVAGYADFVSRYTGIYRNPDDTTSIGVPVQFELYANGGALAVIVGVFILVWLCGTFERFIAYYRGSLHVLMPCTIVLMSFSNGIEQIMLAVSTALAGAAASFIVARAIEVFFPRLFPQFTNAKLRYGFPPPTATAA